RHAGHLCISADVNAAQAEQAVGKIAVELRRLCEKEVPAEELERVKKYETGSLLRRFDGLFQQMERWEEVQADGMDASYWRDYFQMVVSVTSRELRQLARQYLDPDGMTTVLVGPRS
ncbi:MAG: insulinase family protein, partial [Bacteroidales bacterium]|nr:insulinase family protein [Bacteroidales bacterium]